MESPIVKATIQASCLSLLSNILGQLLTMWRSNQSFSLNTTELLRFVVFSILTTPPNFAWQSWLETRFPGYSEQAISEKKPTSSPSSKTQAITQQLNVKNTAIKFALDQTIGAAVNTVLFIVGMSILRGKSWPGAKTDVVDGFWPLVFAGQKLWPVVSIISFTLLPVEHRMVFGSVIGLGWGVYLSVVAGSKVS